MAKRKVPVNLATASLEELREYLRKAEDSTYVLELAVTLRSNPEIEEALTLIVAYVVDIKAMLKLLRAEAPKLSAKDIELAKAQLAAQIDVNKKKAALYANSTVAREVQLRNIYEKAVRDLSARLDNAGLPPAIVVMKDHYNKIVANLNNAVIEWRERYPVLDLAEIMPEVVSVLPELFPKEGKESGNEG